MPGKCDGNWNSTIGGRKDGVIRIDHPSGSGCTAFHTPQEGGGETKMNGCLCGGSVTLTRRRAGVTITYTGNFVNDNRIKGSAHFDNSNREEDPEWVADKQPGTDDDGSQGSSKKKGRGGRRPGGARK